MIQDQQIVRRQAQTTKQEDGNLDLDQTTKIAIDRDQVKLKRDRSIPFSASQSEARPRS